MSERAASMLEIKSVRVPTGHYDVAILGGGLAGLSLANQLMLRASADQSARDGQAARAGAGVGVQGG